MKFRRCSAPALLSAALLLAVAPACSGGDDDAASSDGGPGGGDGGSGVLPDAGPGGATIEQACTDLCGAILSCFMQDPGADCASQCAGALGPMCSAEEVSALDACAVGTCDNLTTCVTSIPCLGLGAGCGDGTCQADQGEDCGTCPADCGQCVCGDGTCNLGECASCADDCPDGCTCHDPCTAGEALDPSCGDCAATICSSDATCCTQAWDDVCAAEAQQACPADCGGGMMCAHDECKKGQPLDPTCSQCAADVCAQKPSCCTQSWGPQCVSLAGSVCGMTCP